MKINPDVKKAIEEGKPVVALESTIISHGMPYPKNVECALAVEKVIRENGAIPATIGIIDGEPIIGMSPDESELFGKRKGVAKVSRRDLPIIVATKNKNLLVAIIGCIYTITNYETEMLSREQ